MVEGVDLGQNPQAFRQVRDREERAGNEEHRRQHGARHVVEVVDRLRDRRDRHAEGREAEARHEADQGHQQHAPFRFQAEGEADHQRRQSVDARADRDPQDLGRDQLFDVDGCREHRVVGALELPADERVEHPREGGGEEHGRRDHAGRDVSHVGDAEKVRSERTQPEAEGEQVDRGLDDRGEGRGLPVATEDRDVATHNAGERRRFQPADLVRCRARPRRLRLGAHSISSPVSATNASSRLAGRRTPSGAAPSSDSARRIASAGPLRRLRQPSAAASAAISASRCGGP